MENRIFRAVAWTLILMQMSGISALIIWGMYQLTQMEYFQ